MVKSKKSKSRKRVMRIGGIISIVIGVLFLLQVAGIYTWLPAGASMLSATGQPAGISITSSMRSYPVFADIGAGYTYQWDVITSNTGTIPWSTAQVTVRVLKKDAQVCDQTASWVIGTFKAGKCSESAWGCDSISCRENIGPSEWNMQDSGYIQDQVYKMDYTNVGAGTSRTLSLQMTPPAEKEGQYKVVLNAWATVPEAGQPVNYIVASAVDTLTVGGIDGNLAFSFIGGALSIFGVALLALSRPF